MIQRAWLPPAEAQARRRAPDTPLGNDPSWQLEMEKAQTQQWFHGSVGQRPSAGQPDRSQIGAPERPKSDGTPPMRATLEARRAQQPTSPTTAPQCSTWVRAQGNQAVIPSPLQTLSCDGLAGAGAASPTWRSNLPATQPATSLAEPVRFTPPVLPERATDAHPARVHVEEGANGLHVWFGLSGNATVVASRAAALLSGLRREMADPQIGLVVCNGRILLQHSSAQPQEP